MIVSVSRRTDIPAFFSDWFFNRLISGEVYIKNSFNQLQVSRIILTPKFVDCFVFWTKDPKPMLNRLSLLEKYHYYFQYTINSYSTDIEVNVRKKNELIRTFIDLSKIIGSKRVIWRYDPIIINDKYSNEYHLKWFEFLASKLSGYTLKCVISFVDNYKETKKNSEELKIRRITDIQMLEMVSKIVEIGKKYGIEIESCAEKTDFNSVGAKAGKCIDDELITDLTGLDLSFLKKDNNRDACQCIRSVDIGVYNSCKHGCLYCYANFNSTLIDKNFSTHNPESPILIGTLTGDERITDHNLMKIKLHQKINLFDEES